MPNECIYDGKRYSDGSQVCQGGGIFRCDDGTWTNLLLSCDDIVDEVRIRGAANAGEPATMLTEAVTATCTAAALCPGNSSSGTNVMIRGNHRYSLRNDGSDTAHYSVLLRVEDDKGHSFEETRPIILAAGKSKTESVTTFFQAAYGVADIGTIHVTAVTLISGALSDSAKGTCSFVISR